MENLYDLCHKLFYIQDGKLIRKLTVSPKAVVGSEAGGFDSTIGYRRVKVERKSYLAHRLIFLMVNGYLPEFIDHINGDRCDNRPENLREVTKEQNRWNSKGNSGSVSGVKGVYLDKGRWKALLNFKGDRYYIGMFSSKEEAANAVNEKYNELQRDFAYSKQVEI